MEKKREKIKLDYKYYIFLFAFLTVFVFFICSTFSHSFAEGTNSLEQIDEHEYNMSHLDQIEEYTIKVVPQNDGTLDIIYHIRWRVLNDQKEGPLTWVKIGIPNSHVEKIVSDSAHIKDIRYYSSGGDYVRIDFLNKYLAGQSVDIDFSIHQSYMYTIDKEKNECIYNFTPGWFDEIDVDKITIYWKSNDVKMSTTQSTEGEYLVWTKSLKAGEKLSITVKYDLNTFTLDENKQATSGVNGWVVIAIVTAAIIIVLIIILLVDHFGGSYHSGSGFGGGHHMYIHHSSCARSSCACVTSCACACACAGGGRAGCSKKDFYSKKYANIKDIREALKE